MKDKIIIIDPRIELPVGARFRLKGEKTVFEVVENAKPLIDGCKNCYWHAGGWDCSYFPVACNGRKDNKDVYFVAVK